MVNVDVAMDARGAEQHRSRDLIEVDDPTLLYAEWGRHAARRAAGRHQDVVDNLQVHRRCRRGDQPLGVGRGGRSPHHQRQAGRAA